MTPEHSAPSSTDTLSDLLLRWRELREKGEECSAEQLCRDRPDLLPQLREHITAIVSMERVLPPGGKSTMPLAGPTPTAIPLPTAVAGYEIARELGRGGMGVVYLAKQKGLNRLVALKMILSGIHAGEQQRKRFEAEAEALARLRHPNIVQVYEVGQHDGLPFLSLEYVDGGALDKQLDGNPLPPREAAALIETLARAIAAAHAAGIVHRDLKPANILLAGTREEGQGTKEEGQGRRGAQTSPVPLPSFLVPKITDFGLAKMLDAETHTRTGAVMGTPCYMAPEQAEGRVKDIGPAADIYALGAILYECLTGVPPFRGDSALEVLLQVKSVEPLAPSRLKPKLARDLETICLKCLRKEPAKRYASAGELADDLRRFLDGRPITARNVGVVERCVKWVRRRPDRAALLGLLVALPILAVVFWPRARPEEEEPEPLLASRARAVLHKYCFPCHGLDRQNIEKDLNILDYAMLTDPARKVKVVVLGDLQESKLIERIEDGSMPPPEEETYARLHSNDIEVLKRWVRAGAPKFNPLTEDDYRVPPPSASAGKVLALLEKRCSECHAASKKVKGGIRILNHDLLVEKRKFVIPGQPDESRLIEVLTTTDKRKKPMPPPEDAPRLSRRQIDLIRSWIDEGAPPFPHPPR